MYTLSGVASDPNYYKDMCSVYVFMKIENIMAMFSIMLRPSHMYTMVMISFSKKYRSLTQNNIYCRATRKFCMLKRDVILVVHALGMLLLYSTESGPIVCPKLVV